MSKLNPYAPPAVLEVAGGVDAELTAFSDGEHLFVRDGAELPSFCAITGEQLRLGTERKRKKFAWAPLWVRMVPTMVILGNGALRPLWKEWNPVATRTPWWIELIPVFLILAFVPILMFLGNKAWITYSLSPSVARRVRLTVGLTVLLLVLGGVLFVTGLALDDISVALCIAGAILVTVSIPFMLYAQPLKVTGWANGWFRIKGCAPRFLARLPQHPSPL